MRYRPPLLLSPRWKVACIVLQVVPVPGVGAILAGWKNPHARLLVHGISQAVLVLFGSWPLIIPGVIGFAWAVWDAVRIGTDARPPGPKSHPTKEARKAMAKDAKESSKRPGKRPFRRFLRLRKAP